MSHRKIRVEIVSKPGKYFEKDSTMRTYTATLQQNRQPQSSTGPALIPEIITSIHETLALLSAIIASTAIVLLSVWVAGQEMNDVLGAGIWGAGFVFLGLAIDNREPRAFLQLITGVALLGLAWLQTTGSSDYATVSGVLVASWVAVSVFKRLR